MADNVYSRVDPYAADLSRAIPVSRTPFTLKFFELINSPQGPWLQMLQRVYYTNDNLENILAEARSEMIRIACS
jgi:multiple sugar transport system substrate-binding protein